MGMMKSEEEPLLGDDGQAVPMEEPAKKWDMFTEAPRNPAYGKNEKDWLDKGVTYLKMFAYVITFSVVLVGAVLSKSTILLMTSQILEDQEVEMCSKDVNTGSNMIKPPNYVVKVTNEERVAWVWVVFFAFAAPEVQSFLRALRMLIFKSITKANLVDIGVVAVFESIHTVGVAILAFMILPELDVIRGLMIANCLCLAPAVLCLLSRNMLKEDSARYTIRFVFDAVAILAQLSAIAYWLALFNNSRNDWHHYLIPVATFMASFGWWENYVTKQSSITVISKLADIKERLKKSRYNVYIWVSMLKIGVFFLTMCLIVHNVRSLNWKDDLFGKFKKSFDVHQVNATEFEDGSLGINFESRVTSTIEPTTLGDTDPKPVTVDSWENIAVWVLLINLSASYATYIFGKFACKIQIQQFSFALPLSLVGPGLVMSLVLLCGFHNKDSCVFHDVLPGYIYWKCPEGEFLFGYVLEDFGWIWIIWLLSQAWITIHIWTPKCERLATTERIFVAPMYSGIFIDQSVAMNRRIDDKEENEEEQLDIRDDEEAAKEAEKNEADFDLNLDFEEQGINLDKFLPGHMDSKDRNLDSITRIYGCATMWHENREEMTEMLKSVFRLDEDQSTRRIAQSYLGIVDPDYYEVETHILFDDAFDLENEDDESSWVVNDFVRILVHLMNEAGKFIHSSRVKVKPPVRIPTPYGGRLVWTLPGKTRIICHLKNKAKIRHRKRWSQVMYMYYLLGFRLMELPLDARRKDKIALNTFLLALDGDVDFKPDAIRCLVDLMKKNPNVGAACGRIHPTGSGPMQWYQSFEYAVGHWLQKATEHVIGCVLCSPGCFSLFRASAVMGENVMKTYTTMPSEPRHHLQYDQGEDRWLCTLLLQQGYRVEYAAASDAFTQCPEAFGEFYNQRRRWVPSTIANILDLLMDYKETVRVNDNISRLYIAYQVLLMFGTILGPGTIFLMLCGAFNSAFGVSNFTALLINGIPLALFMIVCYNAKAKWQLMFAEVLTAVYVLTMLAVIVATALQIQADGIGSPSGIFLISMFGSFFICAILHPKEFWCLPALIVYYLTVPSMYLLLIIYSLFNLNNVSWGTREVASKSKTPDQIAEEKRAAEEAKKKKKSGLLSALFEKLDRNNPEEEGSVDISFFGLFRLMCCTKPKEIDERKQLLSIAASLDQITKRIDNLDKYFDGGPGIRRSGSVSRRESLRFGIPATIEESDDLDDADDAMQGRLMEEDDSFSTNSSDDTVSHVEPRDELIAPYWIEDKIFMRDSLVEHLDKKEAQFWKDLIEKYLYPLLATPEAKAEQQKVAKGLLQLRKKVVFTFLMINTVWVLVIYLLQAQKDTLFITWPFNPELNMTFFTGDNNGHEVLVDKRFLELEPIGLMFVFMFGFIMLVQFIGMLFHRFETLSQVLATCDLKFCSRRLEFNGEEILHDHPAELVRELRDMNMFGEGDAQKDKQKETFADKRRKTIQKMEKKAERRESAESYDGLFLKRLDSIIDNPEDVLTQNQSKKSLVRRETVTALKQRRESFAKTAPERMQRDSRLSRSSIHFGQGRSGSANWGSKSFQMDEEDAPSTAMKRRLTGGAEGRNGSMVKFRGNEDERKPPSPSVVRTKSILKNRGQSLSTPVEDEEEV